MSDLTDEEIDTIDDDHCVNYGELMSMLAEVQRRRAEHAAGREHVERVVREAIIDDVTIELKDLPASAVAECHDDAQRIARRVADRLSVPVLSDIDPQADRIAEGFMRRTAPPCVTKSLSVPVLSEEDVAHLKRLRGWFEIDCEPDHIRPGIALIDRLIAAGKP